MGNLIRVAHGFKRETALDEVANTIENICQATGTTMQVDGGRTYSNGMVELYCVGDKINQENANALSRQFKQSIPIYEDESGDIIVIDKNKIHIS